MRKKKCKNSSATSIINILTGGPAEVSRIWIKCWKEDEDAKTDQVIIKLQVKQLLENRNYWYMSLRRTERMLSYRIAIIIISKGSIELN